MRSMAPTRRRFRGIRGGRDGWWRGGGDAGHPIQFDPPFPGDCTRWLGDFEGEGLGCPVGLPGRKLPVCCFATSFPYQSVWILRINHLIKNNNGALVWWITSARIWIKAQCFAAKISIYVYTYIRIRLVLFLVCFVGVYGNPLEKLGRLMDFFRQRINTLIDKWIIQSGKYCSVELFSISASYRCYIILAIIYCQDHFRRPWFSK